MAEIMKINLKGMPNKDGIEDLYLDTLVGFLSALQKTLRAVERHMTGQKRARTRYLITGFSYVADRGVEAEISPPTVDKEQHSTEALGGRMP